MPGLSIIYRIMNEHSISIIRAWVTATAKDACGFLLTSKIENASVDHSPLLCIMREPFPILANGYSRP